MLALGPVPPELSRRMRGTRLEILGLHHLVANERQPNLRALGRRLDPEAGALWYWHTTPCPCSPQDLEAHCRFETPDAP